MDQQAKSVRVGSQPSSNSKNFLNDFYTSHGGGPAGSPSPALNDNNFRDSLQGYYGGQDYGDIAKSLQSVNTFKPVSKPLYKKSSDDGFDLGKFAIGHAFSLF